MGLRQIFATAPLSGDGELVEYLLLGSLCTQYGIEGRFCLNSTGYAVDDQSWAANIYHPIVQAVVRQ